MWLVANLSEETIFLLNAYIEAFLLDKFIIMGTCSCEPKPRGLSMQWPNPSSKELAHFTSLSELESEELTS